MATGHRSAGVGETAPRDKYEHRDDIGGRPLTALALGVVLFKAFGFLKDMLYPQPIRLFGPASANAAPATLDDERKMAAPATDEAAGPDAEEEGEEQARTASIEPPALGSGGTPKLGFGGSVAIFAEGDTLLTVTLGIGDAAMPLPIRVAGNDNGAWPAHLAGADWSRAAPRSAGAPADARGDDASGGDAPGGEGPDRDDPDDDAPDGPGGDRTNRAPSVSNTVFLYDIFVSQSVLIGVVELLRHAADADGDTLAIRDLKASSGQITPLGGGQWRFDAAPEMLGEVTFTYEITDGAASVAQTATLRVVDVPGQRIDGTPAGETLVGSAGADVIQALGGDDVVVAREGSDLVDGGDGDDRIVGGSGDDVLFGGAGDDVLLGGEGNDTLDGGAGDDTLLGDAGRDVISGGAGNDTAHDGAGADVVDLGGGDDLMMVSRDADGDLFDGGDGKDTISLASVGADGGDIGAVVDLDAGTVKILQGGIAADVAGAEARPIDAAGADVSARMANAAAEPPIDRIAGFENVVGSSGADTIIGDDLPNVLAGGAGADVIDGGAGDDTILAMPGDGSDMIDGGAGIDTLDYSAETAPIIADLVAGTVTTADTSVDAIVRIEVLVLGAGEDVVVMSNEQTDVHGGAGGDIFVFTSSGSSGPGSGHRDRILDFEAGDRIDLDGITDEFAPELAEAISDQNLRRFVMIKEGDAFSNPGQLRLAYEELDGQKVAVLQGNVDHDAAPEFEIELHGYLDFTHDQLTYGV